MICRNCGHPTADHSAWDHVPVGAVLSDEDLYEPNRCNDCEGCRE